MSRNGRKKNCEDIELERNQFSRPSGGPRSLKGKERVRHNATTHGIFSDVVVLKSESQANYNKLLRGFRFTFRPVGPFEEGLVEVLAITRWRQRRLVIAETAEIELGRALLESDERERQSAELGEFTAISSNAGLVMKIANDEVFIACLTRLEVLQRSIQTEGLNLEHDAQILVDIYGEYSGRHWQVDLLTFYVGLSAVAALTDEIRQRRGLPTPEECKTNFLERLRDEIDRLTADHCERAAVKCDQMRLRSLCRSIPESPKLDQFLRYSASLERTFDRTLNQLERAQRLRLGQPVAPQIDVNVSSS
jgi:hypothetical protein